MKTKVMLSKIGQITMKPSSNKDPYEICGRKTIENAVLCKSCGNLVLGICAKIKRVSNRHAVDQEEKLHDDVKTVTDFSYFILYIRSWM